MFTRNEWSQSRLAWEASSMKQCAYGCHGLLYHLLNVDLTQYFSEYADSINHITLTKGAYALIDPHNYMRYK